MKKVWVSLTYKNKDKSKSYSLATKNDAENMIKNNKGNQVFKVDYAPFYYGIYRWTIDWKNLKWIITTILAILTLILTR